VFTARYGLYLCVLCGSQKKQRLFPYTTLTDWFLNETDCVYCAVRTDYLNTLSINSLQMVGFVQCGLNKPEKDLCCPNSVFLRRRCATSFARELRGDEWGVFPPPRS
jgi:hypothetical protein